MLVLSRKKNESIVINNDITVVVVEIRGDKVRLGIEAPKEVPVHRREVYDAIQENEATQSEVASPELDAAEESEAAESETTFDTASAQNYFVALHFPSGNPWTGSGQLLNTLLLIINFLLGNNGFCVWLG